MTCKPQHDAKNGSLHALSCRGGEPKLFEWINGMWNTPKTGYGTKPSAMRALGWRYVGPAETLGDLMKMESGNGDAA